MKNLLSICLILVITSIAEAQESAIQIIQKAVESYGGRGFDNCELSFDFRDKNYELKHDNGLYEYYRKFEKDGDKIVDKLDNSGFERQINGEKSLISSLWSGKYSNSVNSVMYFALLPYKLQDPAVISSNLGKVRLEGRVYHKIKVTFKQESGGEDFEDVFIYWFGVNDYSMDYLAYSYHTDGGGMRFRKAKNKRLIEGLVFQDYDNFKADPELFKVEELDKAFEKGSLKLLSTIELKNIEVKK